MRRPAWMLLTAQWDFWPAFLRTGWSRACRAASESWSGFQCDKSFCLRNKIPEGVNDQERWVSIFFLTTLRVAEQNSLSAASHWKSVNYHPTVLLQLWLNQQRELIHTETDKPGTNCWWCSWWVGWKHSLRNTDRSSCGEATRTHLKKLGHLLVPLLLW